MINQDEFEEEYNAFISSENLDDFNYYFSTKNQDLETQGSLNKTEIYIRNNLDEISKKEEEKNDSINNFISKKKKNLTQFKNKKIFQLTDENLRKFCKHSLLNSLLNFINDKIFELFNYNKDTIFNIKQLKKLNYKTSSETKVKYNIEFLDETIGKIFSDKISQRITKFPPFHNKHVINNLLNEEDEGKRNYFKRLFNLTFFQCLEHFRGTDFYEELNGMNLLNDITRNYLDEYDFASNLEYYFLNYEKIIRNKKPRNKGKRKNNNIQANFTNKIN